MCCQPILTDARIVHQPALDHVPADCALERAEQEYSAQARRKAAVDLSAEDEIKQRKQEHEADGPPQETMEILPPEDALELVERHAAIPLVILGRLLVLVEHLPPLRVAQRRNRTDDGLPFHDRQAGMGEARDSTYHHHCEHERAARKQPDRYLPTRCAFCRR